jgi:acyl-CoA reductase-like NAD-dependent aldehyde dehydrogenase
MKSEIPNVVKTIKIFIGGKFPRTESGRAFEIKDTRGHHFANLCQSSRKDWRDAIEATIAGQQDWSARSAYNRGQILYRMAEMFESKRAEFCEMLQNVSGLTEQQADQEVSDAIDGLVFYAGFCDKYQAILGSVNPINGPYGNTTTPEPVGVVALIQGKQSTLSSLVHRIASILAGGNACSVHMSLTGDCPALIAPLSEVLATSDLPNGVVNLLTGDLIELFDVISSHMDIRSIVIDGVIETSQLKLLQNKAIGNLKRICHTRKNERCLNAIADTLEFKTIWQSVGY